MANKSYNQEHLRSVVKRIALDKNFPENSKISFSDGKEKGDGFFGDIVRIVVGEGWKILDLVAKIPINSEAVQSIAPVEEAYENELEFYENIFPELIALQKELKIHTLFNSVPKYFKIDRKNGENFIILENLKKLDYEMFNFNEELDEEHCKIICETFGKFHALSFALKLLKPDVYVNLVEKLHCLYSGYMKYKGGLIKQCCIVVQETLNEIGESDKMIDHYVEHVESIYRNILFESKNDAYSCVLHCDAWLNNMMFKYTNLDERKTLVDIKLLDWQACYIGSPVLDLAYFLYAGASKDILDNLGFYLNIYHKALTASLREMNLNVDDIYPFEILKEQWKKYCEFGVIRALIVTKIKFTDTSDIPDAAVCQEMGEYYFERIINKKCDEIKLSQRVFEVTEHLENIGVF